MLQPKESGIEGRCRDIAAGAGCLFIKLHHGIVGFPDRGLLVPRRLPWLVEIKRPGEGPSKIQDYWHRVLKAAGHKVAVCDSVAQFRDLLTTATGRRRI